MPPSDAAAPTIPSHGQRNIQGSNSLSLQAMARHNRHFDKFQSAAPVSGD